MLSLTTSTCAACLGQMSKTIISCRRPCLAMQHLLHSVVISTYHFNLLSLIVSGPATLFWSSTNDPDDCTKTSAKSERSDARKGFRFSNFPGGERERRKGRRRREEEMTTGPGNVPLKKLFDQFLSRYRCTEHSRKREKDTQSFRIFSKSSRGDFFLSEFPEPIFRAGPLTDCVHSLLHCFVCRCVHDCNVCIDGQWTQAFLPSV